MMYRVTKSLEVDLYDFRGCHAEIFHELPSKLGVVFYGGSPIMVDKELFFNSVEEIPKEDMKSHNILDATIYQKLPMNGKVVAVRTVRIIAFEDENWEEKAEQRIKELYNHTKGLHYHSIEVKLVEFIQSTTIKQEPKMATKKEEVTTTEVSVFEQQVNFNLPAIPKVMPIGGLEFSEEAIQKEVDAVLKIVITDPSNPESAKIVKELTKKKAEFVKTRTAPEKFRKDIVTPINNWAKELKSQTDAYGAVALKGQEHCETQIAIYENWEAEQRKKEQEAAEKQLQDRREKLQSLGGNMNVSSLHWTFDHMPEKLIENHDLVDMLESEYEELIVALSTSFEAYQHAESVKTQALEQALNAVVSARKQVLSLMQYTESPVGFQKNGHTISVSQLGSLQEAEFATLLQTHNTPAVQQQVQQAPIPQQGSPFGQSPFGSPSNTNPFSGSPLGVSEHTSQPAVVDNNPFKTANDQTEEADALFGDQLFIDCVISDKSVSRLFRTQNLIEARKGIVVSFEADYGNGLSMVIYKK